MRLKPNFYSVWRDFLRKMVDGIANPVARSLAVGTLLNSVSEHTDPRCTEFCSELRHAHAFFDPMLTFCCISRIETTTRIHATERESCVCQPRLRFPQSCVLKCL